MRIGPVQLRPLTPGDMPQVLRIYAASRERDLPFLPLTPAQKEHFLQGQCHAQHLHYQQHFGAAEFQLIEVEGVLAGRIYWHLRPDALRLLEITLLPEFRRRGIATLLIETLKGRAADAGVPMTLQVERVNPALGLYQKLGLSICSSDPLFFEMRLESPAVPSPARAS
jgi:ribosomal protein S18 acetylase RimI-like enzyme